MAEFGNMPERIQILSYTKTKVKVRVHFRNVGSTPSMGLSGFFYLTLVCPEENNFGVVWHFISLNNVNPIAPGQVVYEDIDINLSNFVGYVYTFYGMGKQSVFFNGVNLTASYMKKRPGQWLFMITHDTAYHNVDYEFTDLSRLSPLENIVECYIDIKKCFFGDAYIDSAGNQQNPQPQRLY